jgi:muconate cycloisomerase
MIIRSIHLDEVKVPARADSINSPETDYALHKLPQGARRGWTQQFDEISKTIIRIRLESGVVGLGEGYRGIDENISKAVASELVGTDLRRMNFQNLQIPAGRVYDGFECALLDALTKSYGIPLFQWLGGKYRDKIRCAAWTGHRTTSDAVRKAKEALEAGYDCIKFKCSLQDPVVEWCQQIHSGCGDRISVILDPNERFQHPAHAERIAHQLAVIGNVLYLEDPIPRWDLESWKYLRGKVNVPLSMHVSLPYAEMGQLPQDAARATRLGANDYFNFNSGICAFRRLTSLSDLFEIPYSHGSEIDLGILEASYVHKGVAAANTKLPSDIFGRHIREHDLLQKPLNISHGYVEVPEGAGLGVELDLDALARYSLRQWSVGK